MATVEPSDNSVVTEGSNDPVVTGGDTVVTEVAPVVTEVGRVVVAVDPVVTDASSATSGYTPRNVGSDTSTCDDSSVVTEGDWSNLG